VALRQPGYFAAVAEELSLRRPAEGLFIVQPSLYVQIVEPESDADADGLLDPGIDLQPQTPGRGATSDA
jgi:hypothetical protein